MNDHPAPSGSSNVAFAALLLGAVGIAFAPIFAKLAVNADGLVDGVRLSPVAVGFWRMALAVPFFWAAVWRGRKRPAPRGETGWLLVLPGLLFAMDIGVWHWAFEFTTVANATLEANFAAVLVPLVSFFFMGERFKPLFVAGALLALGGMARLVGASFGLAGDAWIGDLMGIFAAFAYSGYLLTSKVLLKRLPVPNVMAWSTTGTAVFLLIGALLTPGRLLPHTGAAWTHVVLLALIAQIFGQGLIAFGMSRLPAGFSAVTLVLQPVVAAFLGYLMLDQALTPAQVGAGLVVLAGIVMARFGTITA